MENRQGLRIAYPGLVVAAATVIALVAGAATDRTQQTRRDDIELAPVKVTLPKPQFVGTQQDIRAVRVKPVQTEPGPPFLAPVATKNVALGKPVSSSDPEPIIGELTMVTDGDKEAGEGSFVELGPLRQHVTIDLQAEHTIYGLRVWHYHQQPRVYFDVVIQVADDPNFATGAKTVFNNDMDNSSGFGTGRAMHYVDTHFGELFDAKGICGRYVRLYSRGNTTNDLNHYIEVEVYGQPTAEAPRLVPLDIQYPPPMFVGFGRWQDVPYREDIPVQPPPSLMVPEGTWNVAQGKPVSASNAAPIIGALDMITDGDKAARYGSYVELGHGEMTCITIDLGEVCEIYAIAIWHFHLMPRVYFDVVIQISENPIGPRTRGVVYRSDLDNSAGLGVGQDKRYVETHFGKVIPVDGRRGRYVRLYSNGNSMNEFNHYIEVEVYGKPVD